MGPARSDKGQWVRGWGLAAEEGVAAEAKAVKAEGGVAVEVLAAAVGAAGRKDKTSGRQTLQPKSSLVENQDALLAVRLAIASGKGGTGKTTIATNLAMRLAHHGQEVVYVDCDVEAPNGHLFLKPDEVREYPVNRLVPQVSQERCQHCGDCGRICRYNAILCLAERTLIYDELCHSCGGCVRVCPTRAITEIPHFVGVVRIGIAGKVQFVSGTLKVSEASSPPVIRAALQAMPPSDWVILDAPPGAACSVVETLRDCDYVLLVSEPTPFGLHDLQIALELAKTLAVPCGVVVNRAYSSMAELRELCGQAQVPVLGEIPDDLAIARAYSRGQRIIDVVPGLHRTFDHLLLRLLEELQPNVLPFRTRQDLEQAIYANDRMEATNLNEPGRLMAT